MLPQVEEWAKDPWPPSNRLEKYEAGEIDIPGLAAIDVYKHGMVLCSNALLDANRGEMRNGILRMASGFSRKAIAIAIKIRALKNTGGHIVNHLDDVAHLIFATIALGRPDAAKSLYAEAVAGLQGGYGLRDGHRPPIGTTLRYGAFGMTIISKWLGQSLDLDRYALPRDPAWAPLVSQWREPDPNKVLSALLTACDVHVDRIAITYREHETIAEQFEFFTPLLAVHPTEILAVLRLRDLLGLPNPTQIDHPLMQTPYAQITCTPAFLSSQCVRDDLLENFLDTVRRRHPQVIPDGL